MAVSLSLIGGAGWQFFDDNGLPLSGGKIYTYAAGTTTPLTTYTSRDGLTANANPIILDAAGRTPQQIWSTEGLLYKYVVAKSNDVQIRVWDNIGGSVVASNLGAELANTTDNSKGDALIGFRQSNSAGFLPGATARTVNDKLQEFISVKDFGAVGDGVTDDTAAFQLFSAASAGKKVIPAGTYKLSNLTTPLVFQPNDWIEGGNSATVLDASGAGLTAGDAVIQIAGAFISLGAIMASAVVTGAVSFDLLNVSNLAVGDVLVIYNTTNNSWAGHRSEYRAGEFVRIGRIVGSTIYATNPLYDSYPDTVQIYKLGGSCAKLSNFCIKTQASQVLGWQIANSVDVTVENVHTIGNTTYAGGEFKRCAGITYTGAAFQSSPATDDEYGISVSNSQWGTFTLNATGGRHPLSFGGGDYAGCVPCRCFSVYGAQFGNLGPAGSGDLHGNTEDIKFFGVSFSNGADVGGANHKFIGCWFRGNTNSGIALYAGEPVKGTFEFIGCTFETYVNPNASSYGVVDLGNITTNVKDSFRFLFSDCTFSAPVSTTYPILVLITSGSYAPDIIINGGVNLCAGATQFVRLRRDGGAATIDTVHVLGVSGLPSGCYYAYEAGAGLTVTNYRLPVQSGTVNVSTAAAASSYSATVTFRHPYPNTPIVVTSATAVTIGSKRAFSAPLSSGSTGFSATVATADAANFSGTDTAVVRWRASASD